MTNKEARKNTLQRVTDLERELEDHEGAIKVVTDELADLQVTVAHNAKVSAKAIDNLDRLSKIIQAYLQLPWWKRLFWSLD